MILFLNTRLHCVFIFGSHFDDSVIGNVLVKDSIIIIIWFSIAKHFCFSNRLKDWSQD